VGKSTFASFLSLLQASEKNPTLYLTFEVLPKNIIRKWIAMLAGSGFYELSREVYVQARKRLAHRPIWIADHFGMVQLEDVRKTIYECASSNGTRFIVIDHLGHLASLGSDNEIRETGNIIRECKRWSLDLAVHIVVVAHLRKPSNQTRGKPQMEDLRGSSELYQVADNVLLLDRVRGQTKCRCRVVKCRDDSGYEGVAHLDFNPDSLRYLPAGD
jgi:replicative DNA helicase